MKRRKWKITIIPQESGKVHVAKTFIIVFPILILVFLILSFSLLIITFLNIRNIKDYEAIKKSREDVAILTIKDRESKASISQIEKELESMKKEIIDFIPVYKFMSGIIDVSKNEIHIPDNTDSILLIVKNMKTSFDSFHLILKNPSYSAEIPSIVPVNGWVLRKYGRVIDPYTEIEKFNPGILFISDQNNEVYSAADGTIVFTGYRDKLGQTVIIKHNNDYTTTYAHLSNIAVKNGEKVKKGEVIGYVGSTGQTLSNSLYFEIQKNKSTIDPEFSFLMPVYMLYDTIITNL